MHEAPPSREPAAEPAVAPTIGFARGPAGPEDGRVTGPAGRVDGSADHTEGPTGHASGPGRPSGPARHANGPAGPVNGVPGPVKGVARVSPANRAAPDTEPVVVPPGEIPAHEEPPVADAVNVAAYEPPRGSQPEPEFSPGREFGPPQPEPEPEDAPRPGRSRHRSSRRRRQLPLWQEVPLLLVAAFCIAVLIRTFLLQAFYIPSESMVATLKVDDKVLVNKVVYDVRDPARGEIIVFRGTDRWAPEPDHAPASDDLPSKAGRVLADLVGISQPGEKDFIKRVIGLPGDTVACCDAQGRVTVNGVALDEPYIHQNSPLDIPASEEVCRSRQFDPVTVPKGHVFVMGDNRGVSLDSRCQGPVPIENIIGRAFLVVWPTERWHTLGPPDIFKDVPKPYAAPAAPAPYSGGSAAVVGGLIVPMLITFGRWRRIGARRRRTLSG
ncbi:MAG: signal peptidase I [Micromonosporaceae bacterium]|nr:signal peptidase I [Micromonosporaceae bacterium]